MPSHATDSPPADETAPPTKPDEHGSRGRRTFPALTWAAIVMAVAALALFAWHASDQVVPSAVGASLVALGTSLLIAVGIGVAVWAILRFIVGRFVNVPAFFIAALVGSLFLLVTLSAGTSRIAWWALIVIVLVCTALIGAGIWALTHGRRSSRSMIALGAAVVVLAGAFIWLLTPSGSPPTAPSAAGDATVTLSGDPGAGGTHQVSTLTYGSGTDKLRAQYGDDVTITTDPVDLSKIITGWSGSSSRTEQWGFDSSEIPVGGMVWYPDGAGPYPLVLIVHGNKSTVEFSEGGYAYLAEHLASQGMVVASIDENFLNTNLLDRSGGIGGADAARAVLILEHLKAWQQIASSEQLDGKVDMSKIALVGHSRGGEAVSVAAMLNRESTLPGHDDVPLDYGFDIRSVVALAPADGQFKNGDQKVTLDDVSYLAVQGSNDVDVASFGGLNQLARTTLGPDDIGATVYIAGADHSQFNTLWGRRDIGDGATKYFINTGTLIEPDAQQAITKASVSAFLSTTLLGVDQRAFFLDNRAAGDLDDVRFTTSLRTGSDVVLLDGQDDDAKETGPNGATITGDGLDTWEEQPQQLRWGPGDNTLARVSGDGGRLSITSTAPVTLSEGGAVRLDALAADGTDAASLQVEVTDASGQKATVDVTDIPAPIVGDPLKAGFMQTGAASEPVLQTRYIPVSALSAANPSLDLTAVRDVAIVLEGDRELLIDNMVIAP